jgi:hypothetical protein
LARDLRAREGSRGFDDAYASCKSVMNPFG